MPKKTLGTAQMEVSNGLSSFKQQEYINNILSFKYNVLHTIRKIGKGRMNDLIKYRHNKH